MATKMATEMLKSLHMSTTSIYSFLNRFYFSTQYFSKCRHLPRSNCLVGLCLIVIIAFLLVTFTEYCAVHSCAFTSTHYFCVLQGKLLWQPHLISFRMNSGAKAMVSGSVTVCRDFILSYFFQPYSTGSRSGGLLSYNERQITAW